MGLPFTDLRPDSAWSATEYQQDPWSFTPSYSLLEGFSITMIQADLLHVFHLGVARDLIGSTLALFIKDKLIFSGATQADRLREATTNLKSFARGAKLPLKLHRLTKRKLGWDSKSYPEFRGSGYDAFVVLRWLVQVVQSHPAEVPAPLYRAIYAADHTLSVLYNAGRYLTEAEQHSKETYGMMFLHNYMEMVHRNLTARRRLFRLRPKFHLMHHIVKARPGSRVNPAVFSTWMDEDCLRKMMRVLKLTDPRTAPRRILERFLLRMKGTWNRKRRVL